MGRETEPWADISVPIVNIAHDLLEELERITDPLRRLSESLAPLVEPMKRLAEFTDRSVDGWPRLARLGWTVPMWATPGEILSILEAEDDAEVDAQFVALYRADGRERFRELIEDLKREPALVKWHLLIEQCADAFCRDHYLITIPPLLAALERTVAHSASVKRLTKVQDMVRRKVAEAETRLPDSMDVAMWRSIEIFVEGTFGYASFEGPRPPSINRHWILHGRDEATWTEADSLRLFQALHTLCDLAFDEQPKSAA